MITTLQKIAIVFGFISLASCSATWHLKKACEKEPTICTPERVVYRDTVVVPLEAVTDTFITKQVDTITIENERLKINVRRIHDTLIVNGECKTDTIYREKIIEQPKAIEIVDGTSKWWKYSWYIFGVLLVLLITNSFVKRLFS